VADHVGMTDSAQTNMFSTIVWATGGSVASLAGSHFVREICLRYASRLRIVHVAPALWTAADERRIAKLKALSSSLRRHGVDTSLHVVRGAIGSPAPHIAELARMSQAGLLIVGTRGRSPVISAVAGSVAQRLVAEASCPVLVLPAAPAATGGRRAAVTPRLAASAPGRPTVRGGVNPLVWLRSCRTGIAVGHGCRPQASTTILAA
jgi:nucleotide-binding universal stress UspA family protein